MASGPSARRRFGAPVGQGVPTLRLASRDAVVLVEADTGGGSPTSRLLLPGRSGALMAVLMVLLSFIVVLSWLLLEFGHLHDRFNVNAVSGSLLALAERARDGTLYPPLSDGVSFGGTRTMPIPILLYAGAISMGGELLAPAKLVDFVSSVILLLTLVAVLRRLGAGLVVSVGLASTVVTTQVFLLAASGIRPEALPTALQLGALALVAFSSRRALVALAGGLCAVAILCKLSAIWAPIAIVVWLLARDRRSLALFVLVSGAGTIGLLMLFNLVSDGRMVSNIVELGGAGTSLVGALKSPLKTTELLFQHAQASFMLIIVVLLAVVSASRRSRPTIFQLGLIVAVGIALVVMTDVGADYNHLLDLVVLLPIVAFEVTRDLSMRFSEPKVVWALLAIVVLVGSGISFVENASSDTAQVVASALGRSGSTGPSTYDPQPLSAQLGLARSVLAEDPYVSLSRGERPVVADSFMLLRIARRHPDLVGPLATKIEEEGFDAIVLGEDLQSPATVNWFTDLSFGLPIYQAIQDHYRLCASVSGYFLYAPKELACPGAST